MREMVLVSWHPGNTQALAVAWAAGEASDYGAVTSEAWKGLARYQRQHPEARCSWAKRVHRYNEFEVDDVVTFKARVNGQRKFRVVRTPEASRVLACTPIDEDGEVILYPEDVALVAEQKEPSYA